jgi:MarR family 2-MHQ and catechol resistance regulon transcriptional repressor
MGCRRAEEDSMGTHYRGRVDEVRSLDTLIKLVRCAWSVQARLEPGLREAGFTANQFGVLEAILHLGPLEPCELGPKLLTSRPNVVLLIDQLEERGLVRRAPVPGDRRRVRVELTAAGSRAIGKAFPRHVQHVVRDFSALSPGEQEQLGRLCKRLGRQPGLESAARARTALRCWSSGPETK